MEKQEVFNYCELQRFDLYESYVLSLTFFYSIITILLIDFYSTVTVTIYNQLFYLGLNTFLIYNRLPM